MNFSLFKKRSKEDIFWSWVVKNKSKLEEFIHSDFNDYRIYNSLTKELKKYNKLLFPEMTVEDNKIVLILTPDGMSDGIKPIQKLYNAKPEIDNWIVKKFRQPKDDVEMNFQDIAYKPSDIKILSQLNEQEEKVDVIIYIKNMNLDPKGYQTLAFLYLDHILGEFNTITRVGHINFVNWENDTVIENGISILELRKLIEKELY